MDGMWSIYLIRCGDNSLYTGITNDVVKRFAVHVEGGAKAAKYLRSRHPLRLVYTVELGTRSDASKVELFIKKLPKKTKELLISGRVSLAELGANLPRV